MWTTSGTVHIGSSPACILVENAATFWPCHVSDDEKDDMSGPSLLIGDGVGRDLVIVV